MTPPPGPPTGARLAFALALAACLPLGALGFGNADEPADCSCPSMVPPAFVVDPGWGSHTCARSQKWGVAVCAPTSVDSAGSALLSSAQINALGQRHSGLAHASALGQHEHLRVSAHLTHDEHPDFVAFEKSSAPSVARAEARARSVASGAAAKSQTPLLPLDAAADLARELAIEKALSASPQLTVELGNEVEALARAELLGALEEVSEPLSRAEVSEERKLKNVQVRPTHRLYSSNHEFKPVKDTE
ncbi:hypothetical protein T492DRAFT_155744 [Pavlovales sp. CCMP2436]|nr:hypothetical protein T492DRAFT_155744 [Pavlovales sp. CCMP2436]